MPRLLAVGPCRQCWEQQIGTRDGPSGNSCAHETEQQFSQQIESRP